MTNNKKYHVYGLGNALVDMEFEISDQFLADKGIDKGMMTLIDEEQHHVLFDDLKERFGVVKQASGGSAANTIIAANYFGASNFYSCRVSDDETGDFYVKDLMAAGVDTNMNGNRETGVTGKCLVMVTPDAERTMNTYLGVSELFDQSNIVTDAISDSEYLYIEGYLVTSDSGRSAAIEAREVARKAGTKIAMTFSDPAMTQFFKDGLAEMLGDRVDLLFCNDQEAQLFTGKESVEDAVEALTQLTSHLVVTLGKNGALVIKDGERYEIPAFPVKAIDTNGAGDMFAGAYLYAITHGHTPDLAGRLASRAASELVTHFGARLPAETHDTLKQEILEESVTA
ncbi:adenosine kinase [Litoribacillus peritrichatus]|uniref:Adenosine kinase n=1 Tax=Litoribacillus peritrichatus TaxID=718191 RepID=A0ABP7NG39_9GAMM